MCVQCVMALAVSPGAHRRWSLPRGETSLLPGLAIAGPSGPLGVINFCTDKTLLNLGCWGYFTHRIPDLENKEYLLENQAQPGLMKHSCKQGF